jgi:hypothetical protein
MQFIWQKEDLPISLMLEVQFNFVPVSGLSPTVEIYKFSNDFHADFNTSTFVPSGGNKFGTLSGVPSNLGLYRRSFDPQNFSENGNQIYYMRYKAVIPSGFQGLENDREVIGTEIHYFTALSGVGGVGAQGMTASFVG